jgi:hypothetical protein
MRALVAILFSTSCLDAKIIFNGDAINGRALKGDLDTDDKSSRDDNPPSMGYAWIGLPRPDCWDTWLNNMSTPHC